MSLENKAYNEGHQKKIELAAAEAALQQAIQDAVHAFQDSTGLTVDEIVPTKINVSGRTRPHVVKWNPLYIIS